MFSKWYKLLACWDGARRNLPTRRRGGGKKEEFSGWWRGEKERRCECCRIRGGEGEGLSFFWTFFFTLLFLSSLLSAFLRGLEIPAWPTCWAHCNRFGLVRPIFSIGPWRWTCTTGSFLFGYWSGMKTGTNEGSEVLFTLSPTCLKSSNIKN